MRYPSSKAVEDLAFGDRTEDGHIVTEVEFSFDTVYVHVNGLILGRGSDAYKPGSRVALSTAGPVDLSDPVVFEAETTRIAERRMRARRLLPDPVAQEQYRAENETDVRQRLTAALAANNWKKAATP